MIDRRPSDKTPTVPGCLRADIELVPPCNGFDPDYLAAAAFENVISREIKKMAPEG
jgi:hypothetical protein